MHTDRNPTQGPDTAQGASMLKPSAAYLARQETAPRWALAAAAGLTLLVLAAFVAGYLLGWMDRTWYDDLLHFGGGAAAASFLGLVAYGRALTGAREHPVLLVLVVAGLGLAVGGAWEVFEWVLGEVVGVSMLKSTQNIVADLAADGAGAILAAALAVWAIRREAV